jgi:GT2 family glycosyltransferase
MRSKLGVVPYVIALLPLDLVVILGILFAELWVRTFPSSQRRGGATASGLARRGGQFGNNLPALHGLCPPSVPQATIVIVNWDGKHLLAECLPSVVEAVSYAGGKHEILVVDNGSTDGSAQFVEEHFPSVRILPLNRNYGFAGGNNRAVEQVCTNIVVFLNNDMVVDRGFLMPLLKGFGDESVFAVTSQIFFADRSRRREETGKTRARFEKGFFYFWHDEILPGDETLETIPVFWAGGGSCAVNRKKFLSMGGFDPLYAPFYVEDADISYQAWKRGWKCLLAPASRVVHKHRGTSKAKFGDRFVDNTIRKNSFLFIWKNVTDATMIVEHILNLPRDHSRTMIQNGPQFEIEAFIRAVLRLPAALTKRVANISQYIISDHDVLARSQNS